MTNYTLSGSDQEASRDQEADMGTIKYLLSV